MIDNLKLVLRVLGICLPMIPFLSSNLAGWPPSNTNTTEGIVNESTSTCSPIMYYVMKHIPY